MQTTLAQFNETQSQDAFALQNSKLLKVRLDQVTIQAKLGSMVAYQGDVTFEHAGSGGMGRMLKKAVSGEGTSLMRMSGSGEVFLADQAQDIHLIYLENDTITVNGPNLLAFDAGIDWDINRLKGGTAGAMAGARPAACDSSALSVAAARAVSGACAARRTGLDLAAARGEHVPLAAEVRQALAVCLPGCLVADERVERGARVGHLAASVVPLRDAEQRLVHAVSPRAELSER